MSDGMLYPRLTISDHNDAHLFRALLSDARDRIDAMDRDLVPDWERKRDQLNDLIVLVNEQHDLIIQREQDEINSLLNQLSGLGVDISVINLNDMRGVMQTGPMPHTQN